MVSQKGADAKRRKNYAELMEKRRKCKENS